MTTLSFVVALLAVASTISAVSAQDCDVYLPNSDDIIHMDTEQRGPGGGWEFTQSPDWYGGSGSLVYKPDSSFGGTEPKPTNFNDERIKTYYFKVNRPGKYRVLLRSAAPHVTEHNDLFMSLPESGALGIRKDETFLRDVNNPISAAEINAEWTNEVNWFKVYQNNGAWAWHLGGMTVDHHGYGIMTRDLSADGTWYSVRISGRSTQFVVDRIILYHCEGAECLNHSQRYWAASNGISGPQSQCESSSDGQNVENRKDDTTSSDDGSQESNNWSDNSSGSSSDDWSNSSSDAPSDASSSTSFETQSENSTGNSDFSPGQRGGAAISEDRAPPSAPTPASAPAPVTVMVHGPTAVPLPNLSLGKSPRSRWSRRMAVRAP